MASERVAVFGAGGPVGRAILQGLRNAPGLEPIAILRRPPQRPMAEEVRLADMSDDGAVAAALRGCTLAVNAVGGGPATLRSSAAALCRAAERAGLERLLHISSAAVYGTSAFGTLDEEAPLAPTPGAYEAAKIDAEATVRAHAARGWGTVVLRPALVFGPGSEQWAARMARLLRAGRLGDLGAAGDGFCNLTHEAELGRAAASALLAPDAVGGIFNLASPEPPTWNRFFELFARALGAVPLRRIGRRRMRLEARLAIPLQLGRLAGGRLQLRPGTLPDPVPPSLQRLFAQRMRLDPRRTDRILAIPRTPDAPAIAQTAAAL